MIPHRSPFSLIQEDLWPNEWLILVSCMLLNCTTRKQVEKILPQFIERWPTPEEFTKANAADVEELCRSLGFAKRRTKNLMQMTEYYLKRTWKHASELPGIGDYASRTWEIFCQGKLGTEAPKDHALVRYWNWRIQLEQRQREEAEKVD